MGDLSGALMGRAHVGADLIDRLGVTAMCGQVIGEAAMVPASLPSVANRNVPGQNHEQRESHGRAGGDLIDGDPGQRRTSAALR